MTRRNVIVAFLYGLLLAFLSQLPGSKHGAIFRVVWIDPDEPHDYVYEVGTYVYNGKRCCKNCQIIFAAFSPGGDNEDGPCFSDLEVVPINSEARRIMAEIKASKTKNPQNYKFELAV